MAVLRGLPPLTRGLAHSVAQDGVLFVTLADAGSLDFALNWAEHLEEWAVTNLLVGDSWLSCVQALTVVSFVEDVALLSSGLNSLM